MRNTILISGLLHKGISLGCLSLVMGNYHAGFLGGKGAERPLTYPVRKAIETMTWDKDDSAIITWLRFSEGSLSKIDDIELATLKIHLVLEDALKYLLSRRLSSDDDTFSDLRIDFSTLLEIALAGINNPHLLGALRALNKARNHISHRVDSSEFAERLEVFVREIGYMQAEKPKWSADSLDQLGFLRKAFHDAAYAIFAFAVNLPPQRNA